MESLTAPRATAIGQLWAVVAELETIRRRITGEVRASSDRDHAADAVRRATKELVRPTTMLMPDDVFPKANLMTLT